MHEPDFWTNDAEALELTIEGNRLIVREIAEFARQLWLRTMRALDGVFHLHGHHPPA
jgi:hypothetical protein